MKRALTDAVSVEGEAIVAFLAAECVAQQFVFDHVAERRCVRAAGRLTLLLHFDRVVDDLSASTSAASMTNPYLGHMTVATAYGIK